MICVECKDEFKKRLESDVYCKFCTLKIHQAYKMEEIKELMQIMYRDNYNDEKFIGTNKHYKIIMELL